MTSVRASPKAWRSIVQELKKCVLICANCHRELHSGLVSLPEILPELDEAFYEFPAELDRRVHKGKDSFKMNIAPETERVQASRVW